MTKKKSGNLFDSTITVSAPTEERRVVLERKHWQAGAGHFEFKNDELIVRAIFKCPEGVMEIEMSWPSATDLPF